MTMLRAVRRFSLDEYHRLAEAGALGEDDRVELIHGEILEMTPIGPRHASTVTRMQRLLSRLLADRAIVWVQNPVTLGREASEPQPDLALLRPRADLYAEALPQAPDVLLLVEVMDSSAAHDRGVKLPLYARAGITEVWLVDLSTSSLEVHRRPEESGYTEARVARRGDDVTPLAFPDVVMPVTDLVG